MRHCSRRQFLRWIAAAGAAGTASPLMCGCPPLPTPPSHPATHTARVAAVRGTDLRAMVRDILDAFGGMRALIAPGDRVFLKPNLITVDWIGENPVTSGECTKPEIVLAVAEACLEAEAGEVIIGEGAQVRRFDWFHIPTLDGAGSLGAGVLELNSRFGGRITLSCLQTDTAAWVEIPTYCGLESLRIPAILTEVDHVFSLPVAKTHMMTDVTFTLKNMLGVTNPADYGLGTPSRIGLHFTRTGIHQPFLDIVHATRPDFGIVDFTLCCEGNGPVVVPGILSETVDVRERLGGDWLLLGGNDLAAVDATGARIMGGHDPWAVKHLKLAYEQGLGQIEEESILLEGATLEELAMPWQRASLARYLAKSGHVRTSDWDYPPELRAYELLHGRL